ncbi:hypothetical protein [Herpetosiphon llansteffanensis]|uniref:hypothetical protein n=1 Tax=Herpetosiphon llansteffanensis TaxID=2094568 RepID=UPI000D7C3377|nr:hypothetical protein [Herpetosiphon llansteffanensis]
MSLTMDAAIDSLFGHLAPHTPPEFFAEILDDMIWLIDDPEMDLQRVVRGWISANHVKKAQVALSIRGMALLESDAERHAIAEQIVRRWPELEPLCRTSLQL